MNPIKRVILLSGAPGTGKSTIQRRAQAFLRARLGLTAAFGTDEIHRFSAIPRALW